MSATAARQGLAALLGVAVLSGVSLQEVSAAPKVSSKTVYFTVEGSTPSAVLRSILAQGGGGKSGAAMATTEVNISQTLKPRGTSGCNYSSKAMITTRLPRLAKSARKNRAVRSAWGGFIKYIRAHEARHKSIYLSCARKIDKQARAYIRTNGCQNARAKITQIMADEQVRCTRLNQRFDAGERDRIKGLTFIQRAITSNRANRASSTRVRRDN